jgi:hypothetical protein
MVLLHNPATKVLIPRHNDLATEQEESVRDVPFGRVGGRSLPVLEELPGDKHHGVLELQLGCEHLPDIAQERDFGSVNRNPLHGTNPEELRLKERNGSVVRTT